MNYPPLFERAAASSGVTTLLGTDPVRLWPFAEAPQEQTRPYAVWQFTHGAPFNLLGEVPRADRYGCQIDAYAPTASEARAVAAALQDALEPAAYVVSYNGEFRDIPTNLFRYSFAVEIIATR